MKSAMKFAIVIMTITLFTFCTEEEPMDIIPIDPPSPSFEMNQSVEIATTVIIDGSNSMGTGALQFSWNVTDPSGQNVTVDNSSSMISFEALIEGNYNVSLTVTNEGGMTTETGLVVVTNPVYETLDQMGRPAINTVFNFFGGSEVKNGYNKTSPDGGNVDPASFQAILDALQGYIGLDPANYSNALGLDNATTAVVLASDVLMSNKLFPSTYGPSDLTDLRVGENVLNGRGLNDDVVDVTLILTFGGNLTNLSDLQAGLISDGVNSNDVNHSDNFPYLAQAN